MRKKPNPHNLLSRLMVLVMLIGMMPQGAIASGGDVIASFAVPEMQITVAIGTEKADIPLPAILEATLEGGQIVDIPVNWIDDGVYDKDTAGSCTFTANYDVFSYAYAGAAPYAVVTVKATETDSEMEPDHEPEPEPEPVPEPEPAVYANSISGIIWIDKNRNQMMDAGEPRGAGYEVLLLTELGNLDSAVMSATTDASGEYAFTNIVPGSYTVAVKTNAMTSPANGIGDNQMSSFIGMTTAAFSATLTVGEDSRITGVHGGLYPTAEWVDDYDNAVLGIVWLDENRDGAMDEGEPRLPGYVVKLVSVSETKNATTDENGAYEFKHLVPGEWRVQVAATRDALLPAAIQNDNGIGADGQSEIIIVEEASAYTLNAGLLPNAEDRVYANSISGFVWADVVNDGVYDPEPEQPEGAFDEQGIPVDGTYIEPEYPLVGWRVYLVRADDVDTIVATAETDEQGNYVFTNIVPGEYRLKPQVTDTFKIPHLGLEGRNTVAPDGATNALTVGEDFAISGMDMGMTVNTGFNLQATKGSIGRIDLQLTVQKAQLLDALGNPMPNIEWVVAAYTIRSYQRTTSSGYTDSLAHGPQTLSTGTTDANGYFTVPTVTYTFPGLYGLPTNYNYDGATSHMILGFDIGNPAMVYSAAGTGSQVLDGSTGTFSNNITGNPSSYNYVNGYERYSVRMLNYRTLTGNVGAGSYTSISWTLLDPYEFRFGTAYPIYEKYIDVANDTEIDSDITYVVKGNGYSKTPDATLNVSGTNYAFHGYRVDATTGAMSSTLPVTIGNVQTEHTVYYYYVKDECQLTVKHVNEEGGMDIVPLTVDTFVPSVTTSKTIYRVSNTGIAPTRVMLDGVEVARVAEGSPITSYTINPTARGAHEIVFYYGPDTDDDGVPDYDVTISKLITGDYADINKEFTFTVTILDGNGVPLSTGKEFTYTGGTLPSVPGAGAPDDGTLTLNSSGSDTITLGNGQSITIAGVSAVGKVRIEETGDSFYSTTFKDSEASGSENGTDTNERDMTIANRTFDYTNASKETVPTGVDAGNLQGPFLLLLMLITMAGGLTLLTYRRRRSEAGR